MKKRKKILLVAVAICSILSIFAVSVSAYQVGIPQNMNVNMQDGYFTSALVPINDIYTSTMDKQAQRFLTQTYNIPNDYFLLSNNFFTPNQELRKSNQNLASLQQAYGVYALMQFNSYSDTWNVPLDGFPIDYDYFADSITYGFGSDPDSHNVNLRIQFGDFITTPALFDEILTFNIISLDGNIPELDGSIAISFFDVKENRFRGFNQDFQLEHDNQIVADWVSPWGVTYTNAYIDTFNVGQRFASRLLDYIAIEGSIDSPNAPVIVSNFQIETHYPQGGKNVIFTSMTDTFIRTDSSESFQTPITRNYSTVRSMLFGYWEEYVNGFLRDAPSPDPPPSLDDIDLSAIGNTLGSAVDGFFDVELLPNLTIRLLFGSIIGILVFVAFLKYFAGG